MYPLVLSTVTNLISYHLIWILVTTEIIALSRGNVICWSPTCFKVTAILELKSIHVYFLSYKTNPGKLSILIVQTGEVDVVSLNDLAFSKIIEYKTEL